MARDKLIDLLPGGIGTYSFHINHDEEDEFGFEATLSKTAPVIGVGFVMQVGTGGRNTLRWRGSILDKAQLTAMFQYFGACHGVYGSQRTIHLEDFEGNRAEVLFTAFKPTRQRVVHNPRGTTPMEKLEKWRYVAEFEVINIINTYGWA